MTVPTTARPAIRVGSTAVGSSDSTVKSASLPGVIDPLTCSCFDA
jgi:hypothetical protein